VAEPGFQRSKVTLREGCFDTAAAVVTSDYDVLNFEIFDRVIDDGKGIDIGRRHDIGDVSVDKQFTGLEAGDLVSGDSGISTSNPQVFRLLDVDELREIVGFLGDHVLCPDLVIL
jgi:hypothetical protein